MNLLFAHPALSFSLARSVARSLFALLLMCCWLPIASAQTNPAQTAQEARPLELGKPIERELAGGQSHAYQITLTAGQFLKVEVAQRALDVSLALLGPDGKLVTSVDNAFGDSDTETLQAVASISGVHRLLVHAVKPNAKSGHYEVKLIEVRAATQKEIDLQLDRNVRPIEQGKPIERELHSDRGHWYQINLAAGQYLNVVIQQHGIDVGLRLFKSNGQRLSTVDFSGEQGIESLRWVADASGVYWIAVTPLDKDAIAGRYEVSIAELRAATAEDRELVNAYEEAGRLRRDRKFAEAIPFAERVVALQEKRLGGEHLEVAIALVRLSNLHSNLANFSKAELLLSRALAIREKVLGADHLETLSIVSGIADVASNKKELDRAESLYLRILASKEKTFGFDDPHIIAPLMELSSFYRVYKVNLVKVESLLQRTLVICDKKLPPDHDDLIQALGSLSDLYMARADYIQAEPLTRRVISILEKKNGPDHISVGIYLSGLAWIHLSKAEFDEAEPLYRRALVIQEKAYNNPEHPNLFSLLNDIGAFYMSKGDYEQAEFFLKRAQNNLEKAFGLEYPGLAPPLNNLASIAVAKRNFERAGPLYERVLAFYEKFLGKDHPGLVFPLSGLASVYLSKGEYAKAEPLYQRMLTNSEKAYGPENPQVAFALIGYGSLSLAQGNSEQAIQQLQRALAIQEKVFGSDHSNTIGAMQRLAQAYKLKGDLSQAVTLMERGNEISERFLSRNLSGGSERQKQALLTALMPQASNSIALHALSAPNDPDALKSALTIVLRRKGRTLDVMTDTIAQLRRRAKPEDKKLLDELAAAQSQLAAFTLKEPDQAAPDAYRTQLKQLADQVEKLETDISARNAEFRVQSQPVTITAVQAAIPEGMALVEFARYEPPNLKTLGPDPARYAVYVLTKQGEPRWADLGDAAPIEQAVGELRKALQNPKRKDVKKLSRKMDELVMQPVRPLLGLTKKVFISPDGALNLIPFAALMDEHGKYLVANFTFNYLTSGRDLLRLQLHQQSRQRAVIFANPNFGELKTDKSDDRLLVTKQANPQNATAAFDFSRAYFTPLPGTAGEARALKRLLPQAEVLTQAQASEVALKQIHSPKVLHVATHGFFLENLDSVTEGTRRLKHLGLAPATSSNTPADAVNLRSENPLLRSGLAFSGANLHKKGDDDGILTALEASGLDLWGTKLVVLSACDTGVGEVKNGEGVYGLRRALVLAGSETQVMSLWPVSDLGTRDLMIGYYKRLLGGQGRTEALRNTQLEMLRSGLQGGNDASRLLVRKGQTSPANDNKKKDRSHPYYWASFIQSGEWANLDGKR